MSGRNSQLSRVLSIIGILEQSKPGLRVSEIATRIKDSEHKASKRTIYRDLQALESAGIPLTCEGDGETSSRWKLDSSTRIGEYLVITARELLALFLARSALLPLKETPLYDDISRVFKRIESKIGKEGREYWEELSREFKFQPHPKWGLGIEPELLDAIHAACSEGHCLSVSYSTASRDGATRKRKLGPHYLYFSKGSFYLVAEDLEAPGTKPKVFALPRMRDAVMLEEPYDGKVIEPEDLFKDSFGVFASDKSTKVQIKFSKRVAPYVKERGWHPSQRCIPRDDGSLDFHLDVAVSPELVQWILGFGAEAKVVSPKSLQEDVASALSKALKQYK